MSKKNPILSMTGNMWARLRRWKAGEWGTERRGSTMSTTDMALTSRGLLEETATACWGISDLGVMVCDAFTEGQESVK